MHRRDCNPKAWYPTRGTGNLWILYELWTTFYEYLECNSERALMFTKAMSDWSLVSGCCEAVLPVYPWRTPKWSTSMVATVIPS
ncbi:hypothetical protein PMIN07_009133 [Paraphaeosphaeria minitans]